MADENSTPTEVLIEMLEDVDDVTQVLILFRRVDGTMGYRAANQHTADSLGMMRFAQLSMESDLQKSWNEE